MSAELARREVVSAFLRNAGRVLVVRRSTRVGSYRGRWSAVSGYLEEAAPLAQALREIAEETGLAAPQVELRAAAPPLQVPAPELHTVWVVHPFLFEVSAPDAVRLDWENQELRWVSPAELAELETVPALREALQACLDVERSAAV